jgi:hypothetical protein
MLGTALYNCLQDGIDCKDLDCDEETLLNEYITPTLVYQVMAELPMALSYQFYNKGVVKKSGEGQTEPSASELTEVAQRYQARAEFYRQRLMKYLRQNASQNVVSWAQLYQNPGSGFDTVVPDAEAYTISVWLGDDDCCAGKTFEEKYQGNINRCCGK